MAGSRSLPGKVTTGATASRPPAIVLCQGEPQEGSNPAVNLAICRRLGLQVMDYGQDKEKAAARIRESGWIIDAILGTGTKGPVNGELAEIINEVSVCSGKKASIDLPSGLGDEFKPGYPAVRTDHTLTLGIPKACLYLPHARQFCGKITRLDIGFPGPLLDDERIPGELLSYEQLPGLIPPFPPGIHKNARGHAAVFAGSEGTTGAAFLAATACGRSRCGLVTLFADTRIYPVLAAQLSAVMVHSWEPGADPASFDDERYNTFLIGPGWGLDRTRSTWLENLAARQKNGVIDADGLTVLAGLLKKKKIDFNGGWVITPHPAEFARVSGIRKEDLLENPLPALLDFSRRHGVITVLKDSVTRVAAPDGRYFVLDRQNPAMATGGTGDVLSGIIAGFMASGMEPLQAAVAGVLVHSLTGRIAFKERGWFIAPDILPYISSILRNITHG
jgi:hydroxyethylthiazole kinase-like uncharacterized protein yjeF